MIRTTGFDCARAICELMPQPANKQRRNRKSLYHIDPPHSAERHIRCPPVLWQEPGDSLRNIRKVMYNRFKGLKGRRNWSFFERIEKAASVAGIVIFGTFWSTVPGLALSKEKGNRGLPQLRRPGPSYRPACGAAEVASRLVSRQATPKVRSCVIAALNAATDAPTLRFLSQRKRPNLPRTSRAPRRRPLSHPPLPLRHRGDTRRRKTRPSKNRNRSEPRPMQSHPVASAKI